MQPHELAGQTVGHYRIIRLIGQGGMAVVFLAEDIHLHREVAIKILQSRSEETRSFLFRFAREARALAQLDHPNILPIYDYGEQDDFAYLVIPYLSGGSLKERLEKHHTLSIQEVLHFASQILNALQYAHTQGFIHRDIKPGNLLLKGDDTLVLADFGLVRMMFADHAHISLLDTASPGDQIVGTPYYMAPEQIQGKATHLSDIYSVGVVLYEMLTGVRPFSADNALGILVQHMHEVPRPPHDVNTQLSPLLGAVIMHALEKDSAKRYQSASDLLQALRLAAEPEKKHDLLLPAMHQPLLKKTVRAKVTWKRQPPSVLPMI